MGTGHGQGFAEGSACLDKLQWSVNPQTGFKLISTSRLVWIGPPSPAKAYHVVIPYLRLNQNHPNHMLVQVTHEHILSFVADSEVVGTVC